MLIIFDDRDIERKKHCLKITNSSIVLWEDVQLNGMSFSIELI